jgi:predicted MFS family arabinose efflux permease
MSESAGGGETVSLPKPGGTFSQITPREWLLLLILAAIQFTHIVDFMIIMPLGPVYEHEMGLSAQQFGLVVAAYTISAGLAGLVASLFLDRFDRKRALLTLYAGFTTGTLLCAVAPDYLPLLAARTVAGAFGGVAAAVVLAIVGDVFPDSRRATAMGLVMFAFSAASVAGVPLGLHLADVFSWHAPFLVLGGLSGAVLVLAAAVLPPLRGHLRGRRQRPGTLLPVLADANHLCAFALMGALVLSTFIIWPYLPTYLRFNVGLRQDQLKFIYLCGGLATLGTQPLFGWLADRFGKLRVFGALALLTLVPVVLVTTLPAGLPLGLVLAATTGLMVASSGRMVPAMALITGASAPRYRGSFMSINAAVQHFTSGLAAVLGGLFLWEEEGGALGGFGLIGLVACVMTLLGLYLAARLRAARGGALAPDHAAFVAAAADGEPAFDGHAGTGGDAIRRRPGAGQPGAGRVAARPE